MQSIIEKLRALSDENDAYAADTSGDLAHDTDTYEALRDAYKYAANLVETDNQEIYQITQAFNQVMGALAPLTLETRRRVLKSVRILFEEP